MGDVARFTAVDRAPDASFFIEFMDAGNALPDVRALKPRLIELLAAGDGARLLDVGCGTGDDARALAAVVGERGRVCGVDVSAAMIETANARSEASAVAVDFRTADVFALPYADASFDGCRCERVLMHVDGDPTAAIAEMARVTRPGGRIAISDFDWDAAMIDHPDPAATRRIVRTVSDGIHHGRIGRELHGRLLDAGLTDVGAESHGVRLPHDFLHRLLDGQLDAAQADGRLAPEEVAAWWEGLDRAQARGRHLAIWTAVLAAGSVAG
jgi:SAM-dependent methyltransferase